MNIMKKFFVLLCAMLLMACSAIMPASAASEDYQSPLEDTKTMMSLSVGNLSFDNIAFENWNNSDEFGVTGIVTNNTSHSMKYSSTVDFYDENKNFMAEISLDQYAPSELTSDFTAVDDVAILGDANVSDVAYYSIRFYNFTETSTTPVVGSEKPSNNAQYKTFDYVIDKYNIDIAVSEDNTFTITEDISAYFNQPRHGLYRTIPLVNNIKRVDGSTAKTTAVVTDVSVNEEFSTDTEDNNYKIQIGSADELVTGAKNYQIKYTYALSPDTAEGFDEFYYNIIGTQWDTVIGNVTFSIHMPKPFDSSKVGFSHGTYSSLDSRNITFDVSGYTINGAYSGILNKNEALTARITLEDGYFTERPLSFMFYVGIIVPPILLLIVFLIWFKFGKDDKVIETVEFYPPEGFNSLEVALMYKGKAGSKDVVSLLVYLANKGYIDIQEYDQKTLFRTVKSFRIVKKKEYDGNNQNERKFFIELFLHGDGQTVTAEDLKDSFYVTINQIVSDTNSKDNRNVLFEKSATSKSFIVMALAILCVLLAIFVPTYENTRSVASCISLAGPMLFFIPFIAVLFFRQIPAFFRVIWGVSLSMMIAMAGLGSSMISILNGHISLLLVCLLDILCTVGIFIFFALMPKRTPYGNEMLGKIRGFKTFLETAEKPKLEALVMENPTYFYDILPYTYVLGVSDKWIKKFETIAIEAPNWYTGNTMFSVMAFGTFMNSTMQSAQSSMTSSPSSSGGSSGGGSSGGGFSGGGSGGGGGGSW